MGSGKNRRNGLGKKEKTEKKKKRKKRGAAVQHAAKVRLTPPRGGADIRGRMSSSNVLSLHFSSPPFSTSMI